MHSVQYIEPRNLVLASCNGHEIGAVDWLAIQRNLRILGSQDIDVISDVRIGDEEYVVVSVLL